MKNVWKYCLLEDVVNKGSSNISLNKIKGEDGDYPIFAAKGFVQNISFFHQEEEYLAIIKDGAGVGRVSKHPPKSSVVATMQYLIPKEGFNIDFIKYFLKGIEFEKYRNGSTIPHIYFKDYKSEKFPKISLSEQKRVVAILDKAFAAIEQAKTNVEKNIENAKKLFESKLNQIFSQKGEGWEEKKLGEVTYKIGSGATPKGGQSSYKETGISLIRSMNVHDNGFNPKNLAFIDSQQAKKLDNVSVKENDVLLNITGASIARCCIAPKSFLPARVNQHVSIIRIKDEILHPKFLHYALTTKQTKRLLLGIGEQGSTRQAITKAQLENFPIRFPKDTNQQKLLANEFDNFQSQIHELQNTYLIKLENLNLLRKSILQKAFTGELTQKEIEKELQK